RRDGAAAIRPRPAALRGDRHRGLPISPALPARGRTLRRRVPGSRHAHANALGRLLAPSVMLTAPLLELRNVTKRFAAKSRGPSFGPKRFVRAVDGITLGVTTGRSVGVVGESG